MESVLRYLDWTSAVLALLGFLLSLFLLEIFRLNSSISRNPPGPKPLPFVGNLFQFTRNRWAFIKLLPKYGEMSTLHLGKNPVIILNSVQVTKEALVQNGNVFSGRPIVPLIKWITKGKGIVLAQYGNHWRQQRRFALHTLRDFGLGKKTVEERVAEEAGFLIKELLKHEGKAFPPFHPIMNAVSNIICSIVFGDRFDYNNKRFAKLLELLNKHVTMVGSFSAQVLNLVPSIRHFPGPHQKIRRNFSGLNEFILEIVENHKKTLDPENPRDYIDAFLLEMTKQQSNEGSTFLDENLIRSTIDLFFAGTETTATTLRWGIVYMMNHPDVQERCHEEIVQALGLDRAPCMDDRPRLPYTLATVHEMQRCANLVPLSVVHQTTEPAKLRGYDLPKGTDVMPNLVAIMTDREHWKYPDTFNPENFLDEKGQFCRNDSFLPFSLGPRVCLGETLARTELFIFFTSLLQRLHFSWPPGAPPPNMDGIVGAVRSPHPFHTVCRSRETPL